MDLVLNWLWQGGVVAIVATVTLRALDRTQAGTRCLVCWAALLVIVLLPLASLAFVAAPVAPAVYTAAPIFTVPVAWWTSSAVIAGAWAIWTTIHALRFVGAIIVVRRARARCRPFPPAIDSSLPYWAGLRDAGRVARIVLSDRVSAAAVLGCGTPVIAVAPTLVARLDAAELDRVVVHEWAHVQRRDDLANVGQLLIRAVAGWHPAIWWLDRRLSIEQELACDETVVAVTGGAKSYASCLVKLAALRAGQPDVLLASGALSSGGLTRRVARLLFFKEFTSSAWGRRAAALVVVLLVALALGVARLRIVEAAVSATVVRVLQPVANAMPSALQPVAMRDGHPPSARRSSVTAVEASAPDGLEASGIRLKPDVTAVPVPSAAQSDPERAAASVADTVSKSAAGAPDTVTGIAPTDSTLVAVTSSSPLLTALPPAIAAESRSAWSSAADAGVAIGRGSKRAGVATAGTFTRFAKKIADSF
jgi:beta-lactamase regulating signal transducer with metallopeptidase domain